MAQETTDESKIAYEDLINVDLELKKREELLEIALSPRNETWTVYNTKDENVKVSYGQVGNSNLYTVRGITTFDTNGNGNIDSYFRYQENGYNDVYDDPRNKDKDTIENKIVKLIDPEHQIVYSSSKSGYMMLSNRDFSYIRARFKYDDYTFKSADGEYTKKYARVLGQISYSPDDKVNELLGIEKDKNFVRSTIERSGYVLTCEDSNNLNKFTVIYILTFDPAGSIPQWIVNQFAPGKGMNVVKFVNSWPSMMETLEAREKNGWKKDHQPLFEKCDDRLLYIDKIVNNDNNNNNDDNDQKPKETETTADDQKQEE